MTDSFRVENQQKTKPIDRRLLQEMALALADWAGIPANSRVDIVLIEPSEMAELNQSFLGHAGPTDVITFNYDQPRELEGEIFICVAEAVRQAKIFRCTWQLEVVRYLAHGLLHLLGYDDQNARAGRRMKEKENALVNRLQKQFAVAKLGTRGRR